MCVGGGGGGKEIIRHQGQEREDSTKGKSHALSGVRGKPLSIERVSWHSTSPVWTALYEVAQEGRGNRRLAYIYTLCTSP